MVNTLFLPELREMLADNNEQEMREFCTTLHPARTAEYMEGLTADEAWQVLKHADEDTRVEIFHYFPREKQIEIIETQPRADVGDLIAEMAPDDRVDLLEEVEPEVVEELLPLVPRAERRDILRLSAYPEDTAGAIMTTEFARLRERMTVQEAWDEIRRQVDELETVYYLYVVDDEDHLRGLVSAGELIGNMKFPNKPLADLIKRDVITVKVDDDQEEVARVVQKYDFLAVPVVDQEYHIVGIITHDDVMDVVQEEAMEDAHRIGAIEPLDLGYLETGLLTLAWKRGMWLTILFFAALITAFALRNYEDNLSRITWLVFFIPLVISSGGNSGSQSATLVITALTSGELTVGDWMRVVGRELLMGLILGSFLAVIGFLVAMLLAPDVKAAAVIPVTVILVVLCGALCGGVLPLIFRRLGLDPALMSTPFVAAIIDIVGIVLYMSVALAILKVEGEI